MYISDIQSAGVQRFMWIYPSAYGMGLRLYHIPSPQQVVYLLYTPSHIIICMYVCVRNLCMYVHTIYMYVCMHVLYAFTYFTNTDTIALISTYNIHNYIIYQ